MAGRTHFSKMQANPIWIFSQSRPVVWLNRGGMGICTPDIES
jgi:hypothetical protein